MATDYYQLVLRAIATIEHDTADARHAIYERARNLVDRTLRTRSPPISEDGIRAEQAALEEAIWRVEIEAGARGAPEAASAPLRQTARADPAIASEGKGDRRKYLLVGTTCFSAAIVSAAVISLVWWLQAVECDSTSVLEALSREFQLLPGMGGQVLRSPHLGRLGDDDNRQKRCFGTFDVSKVPDGLTLTFTITGKDSVHITKAGRATDPQ
jgi:hypothetical protein